MTKKTNAGGSRPGAGRPKGTGKYKEATCALRVPMSLLPQIKDLIALKKNTVFTNASDFQATDQSGQTVPFYSARIAAGSPTHADDHLDDQINLNQYLVANPENVFLVRAKGDSMIEAGITENDMLVVDKSITAQVGKVVIALLDGEFTVKRLTVKNKQYVLQPENKNYSPILINPEQDFSILGVVIHVIHSL